MNETPGTIRRAARGWCSTRNSIARCWSRSSGPLRARTRSLTCCRHVPGKRFVVYDGIAIVAGLWSWEPAKRVRRPSCTSSRRRLQQDDLALFF